MSDEERVHQLLSYLIILVCENGGELKIDNISRFKDKLLSLNIHTQDDEDSVTLSAIEIKEGGIQN